MADNSRLSLFVFIDAFGWEILRGRPFLDDVLRVRMPLESVLGYSSTCIPTILTGRMPRDHGHFSFFLYDPERSPFAVCRYLALLPRFLTRRGRVRRLLSGLIRRAYGYTGYFQIYDMPFHLLPLFDYSEKADLYMPGGINGKVSTIFDLLREKGVPFHLSDWRRSEAENFARLDADIEATTPTFAYLYLADLDAVLHAHGPRSPLIGRKIRWYEERLRTTIDRARARYGEVRVFVFSDHGQAPVTELCPLMERVSSTGLDFGRDYVAVYDSTMARFWFLRRAAEERVREALAAEPRGRVLSREELAAFGCDFPGDRYGSMLFLLDPGVLLCPSFLGEKPLAAMHGYDPREPDSTAMLSSNVEPAPAPRRLDDMYALMASEALGASHSDFAVALDAEVRS